MSACGAGSVRWVYSPGAGGAGVFLAVCFSWYWHDLTLLGLKTEVKMNLVN